MYDVYKFTVREKVLLKNKEDATTYVLFRREIQAKIMNIFRILKILEEAALKAIILMDITEMKAAVYKIMIFIAKK